MILGVGTDIVSINRIEKLYHEYGDKLVNKILHEDERVRFDALNPSRRVSFLAKRFCAKEAFVKSVGTGFDNKVFLRNICIFNDKLGKPYYATNEVIDQYIKDIFMVQAYKVHLSISDDIGYASALSIIEKV